VVDRQGTTWSRLVCVAFLPVMLAACTGGTPSTRPTASLIARPLPLPSDGWQPGDPALLALTMGQFHAVKTSKGPCAWLGSHQAPICGLRGTGSASTRPN